MTSVDRYRELAPLAALDALDGQDLLDFREHLPGCAECRAELAAYEAVAGRMGASVVPVPPPAGLRGRVLAAVGVTATPRPTRLESPPRTAPRLWPAALAAAAALVAGFGLGVVTTRTQLEGLRERTLALQSEVDRAQREVADLQHALVEARTVRDLVARPESRLTIMAGLDPAPGARGRVVWNAATREAVLLASGLAKPPAGQAYEIWVIGESKRPVPAGMFQPAPDGTVVVSLPRVEDIARPATFAITVEPEAGSPAPTSPIVLAGAVS
jgi:anti-sigma-K factor RskA